MATIVLPSSAAVNFFQQGTLGRPIELCEVYRARDTKPNRDVAIKVLPDSFASDADQLARFTREAQTLASLNHPHIAQIYGLVKRSAGSSSGSLVFVPGPTSSTAVTSELNSFASYSRVVPVSGSPRAYTVSVIAESLCPSWRLT